MATPIRIAGVKSAGDFVLQVAFTNGKTFAVNLRESVYRLKALRPLRDPRAFARADVGEGGFSLVWPGELDMGADRIYETALEQNVMRTTRSMQPEVVLQCLLEHDEPDSWFAICLDLNVYARAPTAGQVRACLHAQIERYLKEAYIVDREHFADLVPRRAPLRFWVQFYLAAVQEWLGRKRRGAERFHDTVALEQNGRMTWLRRPGDDKTTRWDSAKYLKTERDIVQYINACLAEAQDDPAFLAHALGVVARALETLSRA